MPEPISWILIGVFLFLSFFFSASETALACVNPFKMQVKADDGSHAAKLVLKVTDHYDRALTVVLIGHNVVAIALSAISTLLFIRLFASIGLEDYASIISSIAITIAVYIIGDALPKTVAKAIPDTFSLIIIYPIYALMIILFPIAIIFDGIAKLIEKAFKSKNEEDFTEEDLENVIDQVSDEGVLEEEQSEMLQSALDFVDTKVKEVFTPLDKMVAIDIEGLTTEKLQDVILNTRYSRIPIYKKDYDHFIGVLHVKSYLSQYLNNPNKSIKSMLSKPYYVSQNVKIDDLFNGFKKHHTHLALVMNTNKKVIGMVTMEDVLEELVSDISEPVKVRNN